MPSPTICVAGRPQVRPLLPPRGYDLSVEGFVDFLERGVAAYKARTQP